MVLGLGLGRRLGLGISLLWLPVRLRLLRLRRPVRLRLWLRLWRKPIRRRLRLWQWLRSKWQWLRSIRPGHSLQSRRAAAPTRTRRLLSWLGRRRFGLADASSNPRVRAGPRVRRQLTGFPSLRAERAQLILIHSTGGIRRGLGGRAAGRLFSKLSRVIG